jgi:hypothetical protein
MSSVLSEARAVLDTAGYRTLAPSPVSACFYFEDANILGVLYVLDSVDAILSDWESLQDGFLQENAPRLVIDPFKAWNCYSAFLTAGPPGKDDASKLFAIEENFRGTRKLVRAGVTNRAEVEAALAPLLPLRRLLTLEPENIKTRLAERLGDSASPLQGLLSDTEVEGVAAALLEAE